MSSVASFETDKPNKSHQNFNNAKLCIRETLNLSTCAAPIPRKFKTIRNKFRIRDIVNISTCADSSKNIKNVSCQVTQK